MAIYQEMINSYIVSENERDVSQIFYSQAYPETPLLNRIIVGDPIYDKKHYWWEDTLLPSKTTVLSGNDYAAGDATIKLTDYKGLKVGSLLKVTSANGISVLYVSATPTTTTVTIDPLDNDQSHVAGSTVEFITNAQLEGADHVVTAYTQKSEVYNVAQIMSEIASISKTEMAIMREVDKGNLMDKRIAEKLRLLYFQLGKAIISNPRVAPSDNTTARVFGGLLYFINANGYTPSAATFSAANIDAFLLEAEQNQGCKISELWMNPTDMARFIALDDSKRRLDNAVTTSGTPMAKVYLSQNGYEVPLHVDPNITSKFILLTDPSKIQLRPLRPWLTTAEPEAADKLITSIVGEFTLEVNPSNTMGWFEVS